MNTTEKKTNIVVMGGGTGTFVTLSGLKKHPISLSAIVTMMDSGGSSGRLRDELGVLPPGDIRQCLVALSSSSQTLRDLFNYRFSEGGLSGHTFGNLFLSALEKTTGTMKEAITQIGKILRIHGQVIPVTFDHADLCVELEGGRFIIGETHIDEVKETHARPRITRAFLQPAPTANADALLAIKQADIIVIGPGDLYTSIIPNLLVEGISEAIKKSKAKKIYVMNLMTKYGQTTDYTAKDHLHDLEKYLGKNVLTAVMVNSKHPSIEAEQWYQEFHERLVEDNLPKKAPYDIIRVNVVKDVIVEKNKADTLKRSIIRHDGDKLAKEILSFL